MTEAEMAEVLGFDGPVPRPVAEALAMVPMPEDASEATRVILRALGAAGQLGRGLAAGGPDLRRRR